jgi:hypothetical protein
MLKLIDPEETLRAVRPCWSSPELRDTAADASMRSKPVNPIPQLGHRGGPPGQDPWFAWGAKNAAKSPSFRTAVRTDDKRQGIHQKSPGAL